MSCAVRLDAASKIYRVSAAHAPIGLWQALFASEAALRASDIVALHPLTLSIDDGERVGIIGPNGAGKSTLLQLIAALTAPTSGSVEVRGTVHPILNMGLSLRDELSGRENVFIDGEIRGRSTTESAALIEDILEFTELGEFFDLPVRIYSTGMRSRLAFALAIAVDPEILIVDEVLSVGDAFFNARAQARMAQLAARGRIVLMVSHGLGAIRENCTRCLWFDRGALLMDGKPEVVTAAYEQAVAVADERERAALHANARMGESAGGGAIRVEHGALYYADGGEVGALVESEQDLDIVMDIVVDRPVSDACIRLRFDRLDGIAIAEASRLLTGACTRPGRHRVRYEMRPFCLGAGVYDIAMIVEAGGVTLSRAVISLEVVSHRLLIGGAPLIYYSGVSLVEAQRAPELRE